jgi:NTP pyrophosphatase (non-canonical NTP hydrolase)
VSGESSTELSGREAATQQRVRRAIAQVGGYWRPLAGLARLLEELGEVAEQLAAPTDGSGELAAELADVWIISTVLLDQFLGEAVEPDSRASDASMREPTLADLVMSAGLIARIVNYYDGPKTPRSLERLPSLNDAVRKFQEDVLDLAHRRRVDLSSAVEHKLAAMPAIDGARFEHGEHDPVAAACVASFRLLETARIGREPAHARLWGAPVWSLASFESNVETIVPSLRSFARAAVKERFDAFIIAAPPLSSIELSSEWVERLLHELSRRDPNHAEPVSRRAGAGRRDFSFEGVAMLVDVLSPLYDPHDPRHSPSDTFAVLSRVR